MDAILDKITDYTNKQGAMFSIFLQSCPVKEPAQFWGFRYVVVDSRGLIHSFTGAVKKSLAQTPEAALAFAKEKPLAYLKDLLEITVNGVTPLVLPLNSDWFVIP